MNQIPVSRLDTSRIFDKIGKQWMLIGAENKSGEVNMMTASWGGVGVLWNKNVATCYIRPTRYTYGFVEEAENFTLSFYPEEYRKALSVMGTKSGRDCDKFDLSGLLQIKLADAVYCDGAELVVVCKKLYAQDMKEDCFIDRSIIAEDYPKKDFHRVYVGEITAVYVK